MFSGHPEMFPPAPFNEYKWLDFLKQVGLQFSTTKELCLRFAKEIESEARKGSTELTYDRSKVLMNDILSSNNLADVEFLESISTIKFIPQAKLRPIYRNIHLGFGNSHKFISFQEGILEQHDVLVWTSSFLIPQWADPFKALALLANGHSNGPDQQQNFKNKISFALKLKDQPPLQLVITHLKNLCSCEKNFPLSKEDPEFNCFIRNESLKKIYHHLQTRLSKQDEDDNEDVLLQIEQLSEFPCVVTNMGKTFVFPKEVVIDLREEDQIIPHLWKLPTDLGELEQLFLKIGMAKKVADIHYANALNSLQKSVSKKKMHPNELRMAFKAVAGLFSTLHQTKIQSELLNQLEHLHLPTSNGYFGKSSDLIYNDEPSWTERIKKFNCPFLVNLWECGLQTKLHLEMIKLLPSHLKPQMLSSVVSEILENSICSSPNVHTVADKLKYQMSSRAFAFGLARLIKHEHRKSAHKISTEVVESIQQQLASIQVSGIDKVQTFLQCSGQRIPESENNSCTFVEKVTAVGDEISWKIYIDRSLKLDDELQVSISEVVNKITGGLLKNSIHYIQPILSCPPHTISKVLDRLKVRPDRQNSDDIVTSILPVAGSLIHVEDHHLLKEDFEEFEAGEYVGYELDDELTGEATIIYAIVVQKTNNASGNVTQLNGLSEKVNSKNEGACINIKYLINVGDERELVDVLSADLYKFQRIEKIVKSTDSYDSPRPSPDHRSNSPCFHSNKASPEPQGRPSLSPHAIHSTEIKLKNVRRNLFGTSNGGLEDEAKKEKNYSMGQDRSPLQRSPMKSPEDAEDNVFTIPIINEELENAKAEVANILEEAWKIPEAQRKKVVKRLLLKWHPDKNMDNEYFATVVTQFIYNKIESLEMSLPSPKTFEDFRYDAHPDPRNPFAGEKSFQENFYKAYQKFSEHLNRRAKEQKEQRERYKENFAREFYPQRGTHSFNFHVPPTFASTNPQPALAKRFFRQAQEDLKAVDNDLGLKADPAFEWACFKAHQAAEKSLKAAQFFVDASTSFSHDLVVLASSLEDLALRSLAQRLQNVVGNSNKLYNPEPIDFMVIPHDKYTQEMADKSVELAKLILKRVMEIIEFKE